MTDYLYLAGFFSAKFDFSPCNFWRKLLNSSKGIVVVDNYVLAKLSVKISAFKLQ